MFRGVRAEGASGLGLGARFLSSRLIIRVSLGFRV